MSSIKAFLASARSAVPRRAPQPDAPLFGTAGGYVDNSPDTEKGDPLTTSVELASYAPNLPSAPVKKNGREASAKQEQATRENLARFARLPAASVFDLQPGSSVSGLTDETARAFLKQYGPNLLTAERPPSFLALLWGAIANPFNFLLTFLAVVSIATGDKPTFVVMMLMVILATGVRLWQDVKSISQAAKLLNSVTTRVRVLRRKSDASPSEEIEVDRKEVVPGDVLVFSSGDVFPGDCVIIASQALTVAQASLTGEMMPVDKTPRAELPSAQSAFELLDNENVCLAGTSVATGNGRAMVISTGGNTYMASIAKDLARKRPLTAVQIGVRNVSYLLMAFMAVMIPIVFVIQGALHHDWKAAFLFSISVAVGITPEMLPMIVTSNLALSATRVARKKVIVKQFEAIQNLGQVNILCSDKTGTLTVDHVQLSVSTTGSGAQSDLPLKLAYVNSALQTGTRSLLDGAIVHSVEADGPKSKVEQQAQCMKVERWGKVAEVPFDSSRRLLSVLVSRDHAESAAKGLLITKGAVEEVLERCVQVLDNNNSSSSVDTDTGSLEDFYPSSASALTTQLRQTILQTAEKLNAEGLRLIAVACRSMVAWPGTTLAAADEFGLVFVGFLGFLDPVKPDAAEAISTLAGLGVQVRILTGDAPTVAAKVARDLGILTSSSLTATSADHVVVPIKEEADETELILTGTQLAALADDKEAYNQAIERCIIFAKLSPHQKLEVVEAMRKGGGGRAVAFLGDGVNDALAIRAADVGISVDSGTEIAKEAADVILLEKSLGVIADGVVQGRITFINTIKYIKMACSSNFGNVFSVVVASAWLPYEPMLPLQLLFQNLLYDFSQGSIPWDNVDPEFLKTPRAWSTKSIARFMIFFGPTSSIFDICTFALNWFKWGIRDAGSPLVPRAHTTWFIEGALTQVFVVHVLRTGKIPFLQSRASLLVTLVTGLMACIALAVPYIPGVNTALEMNPPLPEFYGFLVAILVTYMLLVQAVKVLYQLLFNEWL